MGILSLIVWLVVERRLSKKGWLTNFVGQRPCITSLAKAKALLSNNLAIFFIDANPL